MEKERKSKEKILPLLRIDVWLSEKFGKRKVISQPEKNEIISLSSRSSKFHCPGEISSM